MKKKIFGGIAIVAIAVAVAFNVSLSNQKQDVASMLALANVEALAQDGEHTVEFPTNTFGNNTASTCTCSTCVKGAQNFTSNEVTVTANSGFTGANASFNGTGGGGSYNPGQTVTVVSTVNCVSITGCCCDQSKNGTYIYQC